MASGPPGAVVESATVTDAAPTGARGFEVLPTA
jgi:acylphosphatase